MTGVQVKLGDFTALAGNYALYRPGYSPFVLDALIGLTGKKTNELTVADVGAGTGLWAAMLAERGVNVFAVEPNTAMREAGVQKTASLGISWFEGSGEKTGLPDNSCDIVSMASSFHWTEFEKATVEFHRILKPGGYFIALWNTRRYEINPLLVEIEKMVKEMIPNLKRISSGRSEFCDGLSDRLLASPCFEDVLYLEGLHTEQQSREHYVGLWESVNDIRAQAGEQAFAAFIKRVWEKIESVPHIDACYLTRTWIAKNADNK